MFDHQRPSRRKKINSRGWNCIGGGGEGAKWREWEGEMMMGIIEASWSKDMGVRLYGAHAGAEMHAEDQMT